MPLVAEQAGMELGPEGKLALVMGGSEGIGRAIARKRARAVKA